MRHRPATLGYCQQRRRSMATVRSAADPLSGSVGAMFLPKDLTSSEEDLVAQVTRELLAHRCPSTPAETDAVTQEAAQVAAEMIWQARARQQTTDPDNQDGDEGLAESSGYHQRLAKLLETNRAIQELEDQEADEGP